MENKIIYPELSYKILGILFKIHTELGGEYQEKYYQRAVALAFDQENIKYKREVNVDLRYNNKIIGKYILDFLVENKIILELKTHQFNQANIRQVLAYLKAEKLKLGILVNFRDKSLTYKRIINSNIAICDNS